jgi:glucosamine kinase
MVAQAKTDVLLLGIDGGGTQCRARLANWEGRILAQATTGPANVGLALHESVDAVIDATRQCLRQSGLSGMEYRTVACLALAGACEPSTRGRARELPLPFKRVVITNDARAACIGAHASHDGAIVIVGTGSIAWGIVQGREFRVGGWGFPLSDEGSGAWLGSRALTQVLHAHDGLLPWTSLLRALFERFQNDPYAIVRWMRDSRPRDYAAFAPIICSQASQGDAAARYLMQSAAAHIDALSARMVDQGAPRVSLLGGLAISMQPYLSDRTRQFLHAPIGDALDGALELARTEAMGLSSQSEPAHG